MPTPTVPSHSLLESRLAFPPAPTDGEDRAPDEPLLPISIPGMEHKSLEEITREQGKNPVLNWDEIAGELADMWETDEDFYEFLEMCRPGKSGNRPE